MSASLVGSEMCIRDSPQLLPRRGHGTITAMESWRVTAAVVGSWSRGTVSYTHLTLPTICSV
eukprot:13515966-Alexandrium_andersonii.AAC.1